MSVQKWLIGAVTRQKGQLGNPSRRLRRVRTLLSESVLKEIIYRDIKTKTIQITRPSN